MAHTKAENVEFLAEAVRRAGMRLSASAVAALVNNPTAVISALAATASALTADAPAPRRGDRIGGEPSHVTGVEDASGRLDARTRRSWEADLLTSDELAALAGLKTRQSVHDWLKKKRILGWEGAKRGCVFPAAQLDKRGRPLPGVDRVAGFFPDGYSAWVWLTTPLGALDGATGLELLKAGEVDRVVAAAEGDAQGDFA